MYSTEFGMLEIPFKGLEGTDYSATLQEDYTLEVLYKVAGEDEPVTVKALYTCPIVRFLKAAGVFSAHDNNPEDCLWELTDHEIIQTEECAERSFLVKVITFGEDSSYSSLDLVVVKAESASKARFAAASMFAEGEISSSGEHVFTDITGYTYVADSAKEVAEQDVEILKHYL